MAQAEYAEEESPCGQLGSREARRESCWIDAASLRGAEPYVGVDFLEVEVRTSMFVALYIYIYSSD